MESLPKYQIGHNEKWEEYMSSRMKRVEIILFAVTVISSLLISTTLSMRSLNQAASSTSRDLDRINEAMSELRQIKNKLIRERDQDRAMMAEINEKISNHEHRKNKFSSNKEDKKEKNDFVEDSTPFFSRSDQYNFHRKMKGKKAYFEEAELSLPSGLSNELIEDNKSSSRASRKRNLQTSLFSTNTINQCENVPILSPINRLTDNAYDERVDRILSILQALSPTEALRNPETPHFQAACWILYEDDSELSVNDDFFIQRYVLVLFMYSTIWNGGVLKPMNTCDYEMVSCDNEGWITKIVLNDAGIESTIPFELAYLPHLEHLDLSNNSFFGTIPAQFETLKKLTQLLLGHNKLTGTLSSRLGSLTNLEVLSLELNDIHGFIPSEIGQLTHLKEVKLNHNAFTGSIPEQMFDCLSIVYINLQNNRLNGTIPESIDKVKGLEVVHFENNVLTGQIASEFGTLSSLKELWLASNELTGSLPSEIGNLESIQRIVMDFNKLTGTIPESFGNLEEIEVINFSNNLLTGSISNSFWDVNYKFALLLEDNDLTGRVPDDFCPHLPFFKVDNSPWFRDEPKVNCDCCGELNCYVWDTEKPTVKGARRPNCPENSIVNLDFTNRFWIEDHILGATHQEFVGFDVVGSSSLCFSPTGCYSIYEGEEKIFKHSLRYSASSNSLEIDNDRCGIVELCGTYFDEEHPKREGLNHLTQMAFPDLTLLDENSSPQYQALCWVMTKDPLYNEYSVCDGTLLQRYVLALLFECYRHSLGFDEIPTKHSCEWQNITCDSEQKFVEHIDLSNLGLRGGLVSEIGLLTRLKTMNLSGNKLSGSISSSIFSLMPDLEHVELQENALGNQIPSELLALPSLRKLNISNNLFVGTLPENVDSEHLEQIDIGNNLLAGTIPKDVIACRHLEFMDFSRNDFTGEIPEKLGALQGLRVLNLEGNELGGSIPSDLFLASNLEVLKLYSNDLKGSIPTQIGALENLTQVSLSHNSLKGLIPTELGTLKKLELVQLHQNRLSGEAPKIELVSRDRNGYITDCGEPSFLLSDQLECDSCTICCNSLKECQENKVYDIPIMVLGYGVVGICIPLLITCFLTSMLYLHKQGMIAFFNDTRNPLSIYNDDSVYCLIFSSNRLAWFIYVLIATIQTLLYGLFLQASNLHENETDVNFTMRCPGISIFCNDEMSRESFGWFLYCLVTVLFLGSDFVDSILQLHRAVASLNIRFFISGFVLFFLTILAMYTSIVYNQAVAESDTELIANTVILLFINDLDEQFLNLLDSAVPNWIANRYIEIKENLSQLRSNDGGDGESTFVDQGNASRLDSARFTGIKLEQKGIPRERHKTALKMLGIMESDKTMATK